MNHVLSKLAKDLEDAKIYIVPVICHMFDYTATEKDLPEFRDRYSKHMSIVTDLYRNEIIEKLEIVELNEQQKQFGVSYYRSREVAERNKLSRNAYLHAPTNQNCLIHLDQANVISVTSILDESKATLDKLRQEFSEWKAQHMTNMTDIDEETKELLLTCKWAISSLASSINRIRMVLRNYDEYIVINPIHPTEITTQYDKSKMDYLMVEATIKKPA